MLKLEFLQYHDNLSDLLELDDSRVLCADYAGTPDAMSIHWARVQV